MIARVVGWSAGHPKLVLLVLLLLGLQCESARRALSVDVVPELADPQIVLVAEWMGHPADAVANAVTKVLSASLEGIAGATSVRGASMSGMAYLDVVFDSPALLKGGRQRILERVDAVRSRLPVAVRIQVGPVTSSIGWVFQYVLVDPTHGQNAVTLRHLQDTVLRPALAKVPGVAEVASVGGALQQVIVEARQDQLRAKGVAFSELTVELGALLEPTRRVSLRELEAATITTRGPSPERLELRALARIRLAHDEPNGLAEFGGSSSAVGGTVIAERNARLVSVVRGVKEKIAELRSRLPTGVQLIAVYDRLALAERVEHTFLRALLEEVAVVVLVIVVFLLHGRSALVPLLTLPLVLLLTCGAMWALGLSATVMSLGGIGIALGMAVDADIVALEACHRRLETMSPSATAADRRKALIAAADSFAPAILTSLVITALSFLPVFVFSGETGRLLAPLALSKTLVIGAAALVTMTLAPALRDLVLRNEVTPELDNPLTRALVKAYRPFVHFALTRPVLTLTTAALAVLSCVPIAFRLGGEFLPRIDEGDLLFMPTTLPGAPMSEIETELREQDRSIREVAEVDRVFGKLGRANTATDPAPLSMAETTIRLKPRADWPTHVRARWYSGWTPRFLLPALGLLWPERSAYTTAELVEHLDRVTRRRGWVNAWTTPVRARMDMMSTGLRTAVGIRIIAADPKRLEVVGATVRSVAARVAGARNVVFESVGGQTWLDFAPDDASLVHHDVDPALVRAITESVIAGGQIGELERDGERLRVRLAPDVNVRSLADQLRAVTVRARGGGPPIALALLGRVGFVRRPATVRSEHGEIASYVYVDLADHMDPVQYVEATQARLERAIASQQLRLQSGERIEWAGQCTLVAEGQRRLKWVIPLVGLSMLGLLFLQFRSLSAALIILASVPFALVGSVWTLFLLGYPLSTPVWVGLLSVVGLATQTAVVMVVYIDDAFHRRLREGRIKTRADIVDAHAEGTVRRLRPKLMTISTMAAGLLPLLWQDGPGAEVMRRIAAPMFGGLTTSAFLTLEVLPVLYTQWRYRQLSRSERLGVPLETLVGRAPPWARP